MPVPRATLYVLIHLIFVTTPTVSSINKQTKAQSDVGNVTKNPQLGGG